MTDRAITPKDNLPPPIVTLDSLRSDFAYLETEVAELENRETPPVLEDDDDLAILTKTINDLRDVGKKVEDKREDQKRPLLDASNVIQSYFKVGLGGRVEARIKQLDAIGAAYLKKKRDKEAAAREEIAKAAAKKAEEARLAAEAALAKLETTTPAGPAAVVEAIKTQAQADALTAFASKAHADAAAPSTAHTRTAGGSAGLQTEWTFQDLDVNTVDLEALRPYFAQAEIERALRAYVKSGRRTIKGAIIIETDKARWRR